MDIQEHQGGDHDHNNQDQAMADEAVLDHTNTRSQPLPPPLPLPADGDEETFNSFNVSADSSLEYPSADGTADEEVCDLTDDGASSPLLNRGNVKAKSAQQKADSRAAARKRMLHFGQFGQRSTMVEAEKRRREDSAVENAVAGKKKKVFLKTCPRSRELVSRLTLVAAWQRRRPRKQPSAQAPREAPQVVQKLQERASEARAGAPR